MILKLYKKYNLLFILLGVMVFFTFLPLSADAKSVSLANNEHVVVFNTDKESYSVNELVAVYANGWNFLCQDVGQAGCWGSPVTMSFAVENPQLPGTWIELYNTSDTFFASGNAPALVIPSGWPAGTSILNVRIRLETGTPVQYVNPPGPITYDLEVFDILTFEVAESSAGGGPSGDQVLGITSGSPSINSHICDIDSGNGHVSNCCSTGIDWAHGIARAPDGTIYVIGPDETGFSPTNFALYKIDPVYGQYKLVAHLLTNGGISTWEGDIAFDPTTGFLHYIEGGGGVTPDFYTIDLTDADLDGVPDVALFGLGPPDPANEHPIIIPTNTFISYYPGGPASAYSNIGAGNDVSGLVFDSAGEAFFIDNNIQGTSDGPFCYTHFNKTTGIIESYPGITDDSGGIYCLDDSVTGYCGGWATNQQGGVTILNDNPGIEDDVILFANGHEYFTGPGGGGWEDICRIDPINTTWPNLTPPPNNFFGFSLGVTEIGDTIATGFSGLTAYSPRGISEGPDLTIFNGCFNQVATGSCIFADFNGDGFVGGPDFDLAINTIATFDLNSDEIVDYRSGTTTPQGPDYSVFLGCFNQVATGSCISADFNGDGFVGGPDFELLLGSLQFDLNNDFIIDYRSLASGCYPIAGPTSLPPVVTLTADDTDVAYGQKTTLRWNTENAISCQAQNGPVGDTSWQSGVAKPHANIAEQSELTISLTGDVTYTISCSSTTGIDFSSVFINVEPPPRILGTSNGTIGDGKTSEICDVSLGTGSVSNCCETGVENLGGIATLPDGRIFVLEANGFSPAQSYIHEIDTISGGIKRSLNLTIPAGGTGIYEGGLTYDPVTNLLYVLDGGNLRLFTVDPDTFAFDNPGTCGGLNVNSSCTTMLSFGAEEDLMGVAIDDNGYVLSMSSGGNYEFFDIDLNPPFPYKPQYVNGTDERDILDPTGYIGFSSEGGMYFDSPSDTLYWVDDGNGGLGQLHTVNYSSFANPADLGPVTLSKVGDTLPGGLSGLAPPAARACVPVTQATIVTTGIEGGAPGTENGEVCDLNLTTGQVSNCCTIGELPHPSGIELGSDGNLYVAALSPTNSDFWLYSINLTTGEENPVGILSTGNVEFLGDLATDPISGDLWYLADDGNPTIFRMALPIQTTACGTGPCPIIFAESHPVTFFGPAYPTGIDPAVTFSKIAAINFDSTGNNIIAYDSQRYNPPALPQYTNATVVLTIDKSTGVSNGSFANGHATAPSIEEGGLYITPHDDYFFADGTRQAGATSFYDIDRSVDPVLLSQIATTNITTGGVAGITNFTTRTCSVTSPDKLTAVTWGGGSPANSDSTARICDVDIDGLSVSNCCTTGRSEISGILTLPTEIYILEATPATIHIIDPTTGNITDSIDLGSVGFTLGDAEEGDMAWDSISNEIHITDWKGHINVFSRITHTVTDLGEISQGAINYLTLAGGSAEINGMTFNSTNGLYLYDTLNEKFLLVDATTLQIQQISDVIGGATTNIAGGLYYDSATDSVTYTESGTATNNTGLYRTFNVDVSNLPTGGDVIFTNLGSISPFSGFTGLSEGTSRSCNLGPPIIDIGIRTGGFTLNFFEKLMAWLSPDLLNAFHRATQIDIQDRELVIVDWSIQNASSCVGFQPAGPQNDADSNPIGWGPTTEATADANPGIASGDGLTLPAGKVLPIDEETLGPLSLSEIYEFRLKCTNGGPTASYASVKVNSCGDGVTQTTEVCDDGSLNGTPSAYCNSTCTAIVGSCPDGIVQSLYESCDPNPPQNDPDCSPVTCQWITPESQCNNGDDDDGDGDIDCEDNGCWIDFEDPDTCNPTDNNEGDEPVCGDGVCAIHLGENPVNCPLDCEPQSGPI